MNSPAPKLITGTQYFSHKEILENKFIEHKKQSRSRMLPKISRRKSSFNPNDRFEALVDTQKEEIVKEIIVEKKFLFWKYKRTLPFAFFQIESSISYTALISPTVLNVLFVVVN